MKRTCLLSRAYTNSPMTFNGREIHYSAIANEILRELDTAFFCGAGDGEQTAFNGIAEGIMVMDMLAAGDIDGIEKLRNMPRQDRHREVTSFALRNEAEIARIQPIIVERVEAAFAAAVESEMPGKPQTPAPDYSPG